MTGVDILGVKRCLGLLGGGLVGLGWLRMYKTIARAVRLVRDTPIMVLGELP